MNKRIKSFISILLCMCIFFFVSLPVYADEEQREVSDSVQLTITSVDEFLAFAESCRLDSYSQKMTVVLETDLDLQNVEFTGIPMFGGTFDGNNHTICGLSIKNNGSVQGLFRYLTNTAVVKNLAVEGEISLQGSRSNIGGIAGSNAGKIENCSFEGQVSGRDSVGGVVGLNTLTGVIDGCSVEGSVYGNHFVGGIAGENFGVIRNCSNSAAVNTTVQQNSVELSDITIESLTSSEAAYTITDIGGVAGANSGVIRSCKNLGNVGYQHIGYNIGGIAGCQVGYVVDCENHGQILGRKEVGGIVGQMEPVSKIEFSVDTLQILSEQMNTMSELTDRLSVNTQSSVEEIDNQIAALRDYVENARNAVDQLVVDVEISDVELPSEDNPTPELPEIEVEELPDADSILAAGNNLSSSVSGMTETLKNIVTTTEDGANTLSEDLLAVITQADAISGTLTGASENLGGSITDISDADTAADTTGKVENSVNYGAVRADLNAGGITGAAAFENDLDPEDDVQISGNSSLNFESEFRAVILNCENKAQVTVKKRNAGGIVGWQSMGLVKGCLNTGAVDAEAADYVGGVAGQSSGYIRNNFVKCELAGSTCVGGIAGSGMIVTDCRSMVQLQGGTERMGAVLGFTKEVHADEENAIRGNYYLKIGKDIGGIDGISYSGCAEPLVQEKFLALKNLPEVFSQVSVVFVFEDYTVQNVCVAPGDILPAADIPEIPQKAGYTAAWEGLEKITSEGIFFDHVVTVAYTPMNITMQSEEVRENGLPILLVQGMFAANDEIPLTESMEKPVLEQRQSLIEAWKFNVPESEEAVTGRYLLPQDCKTEQLQVFVRSTDSGWKQVEYTTDGSYIVFALNSGENQVALIHNESLIWPWVTAAAVGVVLIVSVICQMRFKKKRKKNRK